MGRRLPIGLAAMVGLLFLCVFSTGASASIVASIDLSEQRMALIVDGEYVADWPISSGRRGYNTPTGTYRPRALKRMHYSRKYDNSPMPHSVFFYGGYAIHGTGYLKQLGRPASHGCVRLHPRNAAILFNLIRDYGMRNTRITISY
ncbi:MAG: L,D-transpeptidase [Parvibaculaceae bacterium]